MKPFSQPVSMIYARSLNEVIGKDNALPWGHIPGDLKRFKELTMGGIVVMGRKTWESLPENFRPLAGRINVVMTSVPLDFSEETHFKGAYRATTVSRVVGLAAEHPDKPVWIIGGASINRVFEEFVDTVYETVVMSNQVEGDVHYRFGDGQSRPAIPYGLELIREDPRSTCQIFIPAKSTEVDVEFSPSALAFGAEFLKKASPENMIALAGKFKKNMTKVDVVNRVLKVIR